MGTTRYVSLASLVAAMLFPVGLWLAMRLGQAETGEGQGWLVLHTAVIGLLIALRHRDNVVRLWQGRENKFSR